MSRQKLVFIRLTVYLFTILSCYFLFLGCNDSTRKHNNKVEQMALLNTEIAKKTVLEITFLDDELYIFSKEEKKVIKKIIGDGEKKVRILLPSLPKAIKVKVAPTHRNIDIVNGVSGRANAPGEVFIDLSTVFPEGISAAARAGLLETVFHEFHHLARGWTIQDNAFGPGIPIAAVNEGLAVVFSEQYTGTALEANAYPENVHTWTAEIMALPKDADYQKWMMDEHPDGRTSIGYRFGKYIVDQAIEQSGKTILELGELTPKEIIVLAKI